MTEQPDNTASDRITFPIIALCASAGGLQAYQEFFKALPAGGGMAFIVVQHQHHQQESILRDIIQRGTSILVVAIEDDMAIEANRIYVLPSGYEVTVWNGRFELAPLPHVSGWPQTIDRFLQSLAQDQAERAAAIILSGAGSDGTEGARAVKKNSGLVIAQAPDSASQRMMPLNVIEAGLADVILPPAAMPEYLLGAFQIDDPNPPQPDNLDEVITQKDLFRLVRRLRRQTGRDFQDYKTSTMRRQTARRISTLQFETMDAYLDYMNQHPEEADYLAQYLLINVTNFFRDPEAFDSLKENAVLPMLQTLDIDTIFRAWVPGCATGEEAVSIAIIIYECLRELDMPEMEVRIFASDANRELIHRARSGFYPKDITEHVSESRLHDHFQEEEDGYRVRNHISRMIIWSEHNLIEHPPFSQLHLISCRNVLIYFQRRLQDRILSLFQFALRPGGILFLGSSETMPFSAGEFTQIESKHKVYERASGSPKAWLQLDQPLFKNLPAYLEEPMAAQPPPGQSDAEYTLRVVKDMLVEHFRPTAILVDENYYLRYSYGEIDRYLRVIPGANIQRNVLEMAREGLEVDLTIALHEAFSNDNATIKRQAVWVKTNGDERIIDLFVQPILDSRLGNRLKLVIFELMIEGTDLRQADTSVESDDEEPNATITRLQQKLQQTQEVLQSTTQALQAKSEELTTSMEEIRSANEEVQTTNEELRTSKEELESMNEELNTLNAQLTDQNYELTRAKNTLHNFLQSTEIGMIFLDQDLLIREYTTAVTNIFGLRRSDLGRPLTEIAAQVPHEDLIADANRVLDTLESLEKEIHTTDGSWYNLRIRPYRTTSNVIDGLVLTFADVTAQKQAHAEIRLDSYIRQLFDTINHSALELDSNLRVLVANAPFYETFQRSEEDTLGQRIYELDGGNWDSPDLHRLLDELLPKQASVLGYEAAYAYAESDPLTLRINARLNESLDRVLLVITDIFDGAAESDTPTEG